MQKLMSGNLIVLPGIGPSFQAIVPSCRGKCVDRDRRVQSWSLLCAHIYLPLTGWSLHIQPQGIAHSKYVILTEPEAHKEVSLSGKRPCYKDTHFCISLLCGGGTRAHWNPCDGVHVWWSTGNFEESVFCFNHVGLETKLKS